MSLGAYRRWPLWLCLGAVLYGPVAVGALPARPWAVLPAALLAFSIYAFGFSASARLKKLALVAVSVCFAVTCFDLAARLAPSRFLGGRPKELLPRRWPPLPLLYRFEADVSFRGETYGDLAAMAGRRDWGEPREVTFTTDAHGFRNDPSDGGVGARPPDLILLGDSYCVGDGTSQESTWWSRLRRDRGLAVYNLCMDGAGPWQEYVNLLVEGKRLPAREGTRVLWLLFAGNDLDDDYHPWLEESRLPWHGPLARLRFRAGEFRRRSAVRRMLPARGAAADRVIERTLADGRRVLFVESSVRRAARTAAEVERHPHYENLRAIFGAMKRLADERRWKVLVALAPPKEEVYAWALEGGEPWSEGAEPSGFSVALEGLARQQGFPFLDLKPALVASARRASAESGELLWWRDDTHWNAAGHRAAADILYDELLSKKE